MKNTTNPELINLVRELKKWSRDRKVNIWRDLAERLTKSKKRRITVNVSRINRNTKRGETIVVPGKVLGAGRIDHPVKVAAFTFSDQARSKIWNAKGNCLSILELIKENPDGTNVKVIG